MSESGNRYESIKQASKLAIEELSFEGVVDDVLTKVVHESIKKYQQKLSVGMEDSISDLLDNFKHKITELIFDTSSSWKVANKEPVVFPRGCRYAYDRGSSTIFVIEQDPGTRTIKFSNKKRFSLAMPYVIFVVQFEKNKFYRVYCGWRTSPLQKLDDLICRPLLPNIHDNLSVCIDVKSSRVGYTAQTEDVITNFWNSEFSNDLSDRWKSKGEVSPKFDNEIRWQQESENNPLFVLDMDFGHSKTVQSVIDLLTKYEVNPNESQFRNLLSENIDDCVGFLFSRLVKYFKKTKFEKHAPKDVTEQLKFVITNAMEDFVDVVKELDREISSFSEPKDKMEVVGVGDFWTDCPS